MRIVSRAYQGQHLYFDSIPDDNHIAQWRLIDPLGREVFSDSMGDDIEALTLSVSGSYTLLIEGTQSSEGELEYEFNIFPVTPATPITLDTPVTGTRGYQEFTFTLDGRTRIWFDAITARSGLTWELHGPRGQVTQAARFNQSDSWSYKPLQLLEEGTYTVIIRNSVLGALHVPRLRSRRGHGHRARRVALGIALQGSETDLYRFEASAGDR